MRHLQMSRWQTRTAEDGTVTVEGLAVPYGQTIDYAGFRECFAAGAFDPDDVTGSPLLRDHDRTGLVGHVTAARNTAEGLEVEAIVQPTSLGRDTATLLRSGSLRGLSVGFEPVDTDHTGGIATYRAARLHELSLTPMPAYTTAAVAAVRHQQEEPVSTTEAPEVTEERASVDLSDYATRADLDALVARLQSAPAPQPRHMPYRDAVVAAIQAFATDRREGVRALADVVGSGNAGLLPPTWSGEVRTYVDSARPLFTQAGTVGFPGSGYGLTVPKITQGTAVAKRSAEKGEAASQALTSGSDTYSIEWFAGAVDVAMEVVEQSSPEILGVIVDDLLGRYAVATETEFVVDTLAAATAGGAALDLTDYGTFINDVIGVSADIRAATGLPGDRLGLTTASWKAVLGLVDGDNRRVLSTTGATNADGSASLVAEAVNIGGVLVFHAPLLTADVQFNTKSLRKAEKPPMQLRAVNVPQMGIDLGIIGATIAAPLYPAGIVKFTAPAQGAAAGKK